jgi:hypothetical protein
MVRGAFGYSCVCDSRLRTGEEEEGYLMNARLAWKQITLVAEYIYIHTHTHRRSGAMTWTYG